MKTSIRYASTVAALTATLLAGCGGGGGGGSTGTPAGTSAASTSTTAAGNAASSANGAATSASTPAPTPATTTPTTSTAGLPSVFSRFTSNVKVSQDGDYVVLETDDLPNHRSVYWPTTSSLYAPYDGSNPNFARAPSSSIQAQTVTLRVPLSPTPAAVKQATRLGPIGISLNGVVFFNQYNGAGQPLTTEIDSFDQYNGHPNPMNMYHYHVEPLYLTQSFGKDALIGFLADGYPVYGTTENGRAVTNADLDAYHGHTAPTADYPNGIYHYHITAEDPYINGGSYYGTPGTISQ